VHDFINEDVLRWVACCQQAEVQQPRMPVADSVFQNVLELYHSLPKISPLRPELLHHCGKGLSDEELAETFQAIPRFNLL
jgi:hypothetical protein